MHFSYSFHINWNTVTILYILNESIPIKAKILFSIHFERIIMCILIEKCEIPIRLIWFRNYFFSCALHRSITKANFNATEGSNLIVVIVKQIPRQWNGNLRFSFFIFFSIFSTFNVVLLVPVVGRNNGNANRLNQMSQLNVFDYLIRTFGLYRRLN